MKVLPPNEIRSLQSTILSLSDVADLRDFAFMSRRALFMAAGHCLGGGVSPEIAAALGIPHPIKSTDLQERARAEGYDPGELWEWTRPSAGRKPYVPPAADAVCDGCKTAFFNPLPLRCPTCRIDLMDARARANIEARGFIPWPGGERPFVPESLIHVLLRNGAEEIGRACEHAWGRHEMSFAEDVVGYQKPEAR